MSMSISDQTQKALLAVGTGIALVLSIIALVVALNDGGGHGDGGRMHGGDPQQMMQGGPGQRGMDGPQQGQVPPGFQQAPNGGTTTTK
jgi:hypothetical protein